MFRTNSWIIEPGDLGPRLVLHGPWTDAARSIVKKRGIAEIELNRSKGWRGDNVDFMRDVRDSIRGLLLIDRVIDDAHGIRELSLLKRLTLLTYCKTPVDADAMPELERVALEWRTGAKSLLAHANISHLYINKFPYADVSACAAMRSLRSLHLDSPKLQDLTGLDRHANLHSLVVRVARSLECIKALGGCPRLRKLALDECRKITSLDPIGRLAQLRDLSLCDLGRIETVSWAGSLTRLEKLMFYGSTLVADGDLSSLTELRHLQEVSFQNRRHYSHRREEFYLDSPE